MIDVDAYYEQKIGLLWRTLRGGLWHATPSHRFRTILKTGHILCDPQLVEGEFQWASANGFTTLCRDIGAVSLFDFGEADWPWIFENHHDWLSFLKAPQLAVPEDKWIAIVWIGFDRQSLKNLMDLDSVKEEWKQDSTRKLMHRIEVCHKGTMLLSTCCRAVANCAINPNEFLEFDVLDIQALEEAEKDWKARYSEEFRMRSLPKEQQQM